MSNGKKPKKPRLNQYRCAALQAAAVMRTDARTLEESFEHYWSLSHPERHKEYLSTYDAAEFFDIPQRTLQNWIDLGYVRVLPIGRRNLVEVAALKTFIVESGKARLGL